MDGRTFLQKIVAVSDAYHEQLESWYTKEQDISLVPDPVVEGMIGLCSSLYMTFSYEMEGLDKWYAKSFNETKFSTDPPLSDKATDQMLRNTDNGGRMITLERRLKALKFMKESLSRSVQARIEARRDIHQKYGQR